MSITTDVENGTVHLLISVEDAARHDRDSLREQVRVEFEGALEDFLDYVEAQVAK